MARNGHPPYVEERTADFAKADKLPTNVVEGAAYVGKKWGFQAILLLLACGFIWWQASTSREDLREANKANLQIQLKTVEVLTGLRTDVQAVRAANEETNRQLQEVKAALYRTRPERTPQ